MSEYTEETVPYEFLARWDQLGQLSAAHVGFRTITKKDGVVISDQPQPVQSVAVGTSAGFPLSDILDQLHIDALARISALEATSSGLPAPATPSVSIPRWKGRAYLTSQPVATEGPLAAFSGDNLLEQVDFYMTANLTAGQLERYEGTATWERNDVMISQMATLLGLTEEQIDAWFAAAGAIE